MDRVHETGINCIGYRVALEKTSRTMPNGAVNA